LKLLARWKGYVKIASKFGINAEIRTATAFLTTKKGYTSYIEFRSIGE
jgi:hypothetical protein